MIIDALEEAITVRSPLGKKGLGAVWLTNHDGYIFYFLHKALHKMLRWIDPYIGEKGDI